MEGRNTPHTKEKLQDNDDLEFNVCYLQFTNIGQLHWIVIYEIVLIEYRSQYCSEWNSDEIYW